MGLESDGAAELIRQLQSCEAASAASALHRAFHHMAARLQPRHPAPCRHRPDEARVLPQLRHEDVHHQRLSCRVTCQGRGVRQRRRQAMTFSAAAINIHDTLLPAGGVNA
jgi:hypothetical protein